MKYEKPEAYNLGSASELIHGTNKTSLNKETGQQMPSPAAYEADE